MYVFFLFLWKFLSIMFKKCRLFSTGFKARRDFYVRKAFIKIHEAQPMLYSQFLQIEPFQFKADHD